MTTTTLKTPVCILGAGPAGASAALKLNKLNVPCIVVDKAQFPRDKICGDGLSHRVTDIMKRWLYPELFEKFAAATDIQLDSWGLRVEGTRRNAFDIGYRAHYNKKTDAPPGFTCKRMWFDNFLVNEVKTAHNVQLFENTEITAFTKTENGWLLTDKNNTLQIETQLLLVADGAHSRFARTIAGIELDAQHNMASVKTYYKNVEPLHPDNYLEFYFLENFLPGYFWVFALPNNEVNVGIAMVSAEVAKRKLNLKNCLEEIITENPIFKERFKNAEHIAPIQGFGLPLASKKRQLSGAHYLLLGDAASLIDPLTGEGIANAMLSGVVAAEQAHKCVTTNNFSSEELEKYNTRIYRMRGEEFRVSYWLQQQFRKKWFFNSLSWIVAKNKPLARTFAYVFNDVNLKKQLRSPAFWWSIVRNKV